MTTFLLALPQPNRWIGSCSAASGGRACWTLQSRPTHNRWRPPAGLHLRRWAELEAEARLGPAAPRAAAAKRLSRQKPPSSRRWRSSVCSRYAQLQYWLREGWAACLWHANPPARATCQPQPPSPAVPSSLTSPRAWARPPRLRHWRHTTPQSPSHPTKPCWLRSTAKTTQARPVPGALQAAEQLLCPAARAAALLSGMASHWDGSTLAVPSNNPTGHLLPTNANVCVQCQKCWS